MKARKANEMSYKCHWKISISQIPNWTMAMSLSLLSYENINHQQVWSLHVSNIYLTTNPKYGLILKKIIITQNSVIKAWIVPKLCLTLKLQLPTQHMRCPTEKNRMLIKYSDKDDIELNTLMKRQYIVQEDLLMRKTKLIHSTEKHKHHRTTN